MSSEIERKYLWVSRHDLRGRAEELGGVPQGGPHFESNRLYDDAAGSLFADGRLLRLRTREWKDKSDARLTFKKPLPPVMVSGRPVKCRDEVEIGVDDPKGMERILHELGYRETGGYEKVRESYVLDGAHLDMDELPFGNVVEIEADPAAMAELEKALGLDKCPTSAKSYYELFMEWLAVKGRKPEKLCVFDEETRRKLRLSLGLQS